MPAVRLSTATERITSVTDYFGPHETDLSCGASLLRQRSNPSCGAMGSMCSATAARVGRAKAFSAVSRKPPESFASIQTVKGAYGDWMTTRTRRSLCMATQSPFGAVTVGTGGRPCALPLGRRRRRGGSPGGRRASDQPRRRRPSHWVRPGAPLRAGRSLVRHGSARLI